MVAPELLELLVCPETHLPLRSADSGLLARLNDAVAAGTLVNRGGEFVREPLHEALLRDDGRILYPVKDGIPVMLIDEAISLETLP